MPELRPGAPDADRRRPPTSSCAASAPPRSRSTARRVELPLPGLYNVYNALGAAALTLRLGVELDDVVAGLQAVAPAFGRAETLDLGRPDLACCWSRTRPARTRCSGRSRWRASELDLLGVLNDRIADGRDVSWVWDADWELLVGSVRRFTASGTRAAELALRMKYAGLDPDRIHVVDDLEQGLDDALADGDGPLYVVPTYTALLELRELLTRRGQAEAYWR